ncbi:MAG: FixH family protein [Nitrospirae bacterium]|nr:FixH family protein [Nitrospirota bacterium]
MKKLIVSVVCLIFIVAGVAFAKDYEVKKKAGDLDVVVTIDKNPPVVGENNLAIEVKDAAGKYVTDAKVKVEYGMSAMPGMPAMDYKTDAKIEGDKYKAVMELSMSGPWNVTIKITRGEKTSKVKFSVDAQ